jgi:nucleoside-diphosphate-sugar epimerase
MKALVTGGGGFLGRAIVEQLLARGDAVTILSRRRYPEIESLGASGMAVDLSADVPDLAEKLAGFDVVFHVAARAGVWGKKADFFSINVEGTRRILSAAQQAGVPRFVYTSSPSAVWSGADEDGLSEADCPYPAEYLAFYPESKAVAERMVLEASASGFATTALRPHLIWGPRDPHLVPRLLERGRAGRLRIVGEGTNRVGITYVDNAAHAHLLAADALAPESANAGKAYFITDDAPVVLWEWVNTLFAALDVAPVTRRVPVGVARLAGAVLEWIWRAFSRPGEPPMTRFVAGQLSTHHHYDLSAAQRDFGYAMKIDPDEGFRRMVAYFKEQG